jgi:hypothetical protein
MFQSLRVGESATSAMLRQLVLAGNRSPGEVARDLLYRDVNAEAKLHQSVGRSKNASRRRQRGALIRHNRL